MRHLASHSNRSYLDQFSSYLYGQGIESELERTDDGNWMLWVLDDDHLEQAQEFYAQYQENPDHPEFAKGAEQGTQKFREDKRAAKKSKANIIEGRTKVFSGGNINANGIPFITSGLLVLCIGIFAISYIDPDFYPRLQSLLFISMEDNRVSMFSEVKSGQIWRLFTPVLMHGSLLHILFNLYWMATLGSRVEKFLGPLYYALLVLASAILPNVFQYILVSPGFLGISGVVFALIGFAFLYEKLNPTVTFAIDNGLFIFAMIWMIAGFMGFMNMANWAHLGGLAVGLSAAFLLSKAGKLQPTR